MKKAKFFLIIIAIITNNMLTAQVAINTDGSNPDDSAILDVKSTNKGFLPPRVAQVSDISNPVAGLMIFDKFNHCMRFYNGTEWSDCMGSSSTCPKTITDTSNNTYNVVKIGNQCWMAENINIGSMITGNNSQTNNNTIEKHCYDNSTTNCNIYGGLYQWNEAMQYVTTEGAQGICPTGWHIPTDAEYKTLEMQLGMTQAQADATGWRGTDEGSKLANNEPLWTNGDLDQNANLGSSSFDALPGGNRSENTSFYNRSKNAYFWTSNQNGSDAWRRVLHYSRSTIYRTFFTKERAYSIRCLKN